MTGGRVPLRDVSAGLFVVCLGAFAAWEASGYSFGSLRSIGSGFFPVMLGLLAVLIGAAILWESVTRHEVPETEQDRESFDLRPVVAVVAALFAFALLIDRAGLAPAVFASAVIAAFAERTSRLAGVLMLAGGLAVLCAAIFVFALKLPIRIW